MTYEITSNDVEVMKGMIKVIGKMNVKDASFTDMLDIVNQVKAFGSILRRIDEVNNGITERQQ